MKIIFVGDSMGLPREGCEYEDTYFYKFQKEYKEIDCISFFKRAMTSDGLYELYESYIRHYNPDIVISHSGLTDCAPRLINDRKYFWRGLIYVSKRLGRLNLFWLIIKKIFERNDPKRAYISVNEFRKNYIAFTEKLINIGVKKIVYIKISPCGEGGNLAASKIRNLECPNYEICLIDYGCGKFNRKIHIMEQYP